MDFSFFFDSLFFISCKLANGKCKLNVVSNYLGRISCFEVGNLPGVNSILFTTTQSAKRKGSLFLFLIGTDNIYLRIQTLLDDLIVYQGCFLDFISYFYNVSFIFPVTVYTERISTYLNMEGRLRRTRKASFCFPFVYTDCEIFKALFFFRSFFFFQIFRYLRIFFIYCLFLLV